jgi:hypothetical protein
MNIFIKKLSIAFFLVGLLSNPAFAQGVVENIEGFPLLPSFSEDESRGLFFDKPEGRVIEGVVEGSAILKDVQTFYKQNLSQIGWVIEPSMETENLLRFNKEGETLTLDFKEINHKIQVLVFLVPSGSM